MTSSCKPFLYLAGLTLLVAANAVADITLVENGKALGALIVADDLQVKEEAERFSLMVQQATGAALPIIPEAEAGSLPDTTPRIYLGPTAAAKAAGLEKQYAEETYQLATRGNSLFILGHLAPIKKPQAKVVSKPIRWALNEILSKQLGVRWLWPGELGTYVPKRSTLTLPDLDRTYQPPLMMRKLRIGMNYVLDQKGDDFQRQIEREAFDWLENHQGGERGNLSFEHAFGHWWAKYSEKHPDYFAEALPGFTQPYPSAGTVKLRLSNPAVIEAIAKEYEAAGAPDYYDVGPNDGSGFDISEATRALDIPANQSSDEIWGARGNLTARYVDFWNRLYARLKQINPSVTLGAFAYSSYSQPPPAERPLTAQMYINIVDMPDAFESWNRWHASGAGLFLRPNWWHFGARAPYLQLNDFHRFLVFAWKHGMKGLDMDSIIGTWATQGVSYYMVARLMSEPELSKEQIISEYAQAFGPAASKVEEYIAYWERLTVEQGYPHLGGPNQVRDKSKLYPQLLEQGKILGDLTAPHDAIPFLYTDQVLNPAYALLDQAAKLVDNPTCEEGRRIIFLRQGLDELKASRELLLIGKKYRRNPSPENLALFEKENAALEAFRRKLSATHVVWGDYLTTYENYYLVKIRPQNFQLPARNLEGQF